MPKKTRFTFKGLQSILNSSQGDAILCAWAQDFNLIYNDAEENIEFEVVDSAQQVPTRSFKNNPDLVLPYLMSMVLQKKKFDIYDVASLQYKESDRMLAIEIELSKCQVVFKKTEKGYTIDASKLHVKPNMFFDSHNDHRIAMCLAPLAFFAPITILNPDVVNKSFPKYWDELRKVNFEVINN